MALNHRQKEAREWVMSMEDVWEAGLVGMPRSHPDYDDIRKQYNEYLAILGYSNWPDDGLPRKGRGSAR